MSGFGAHSGAAFAAASALALAGGDAQGAARGLAAALALLAVLGGVEQGLVVLKRHLPLFDHGQGVGHVAQLALDQDRGLPGRQTYSSTTQSSLRTME